MVYLCYEKLALNNNLDNFPRIVQHHLKTELCDFKFTPSCDTHNLNLRFPDSKQSLLANEKRRTKMIKATADKDKTKTAKRNMHKKD